MHLQFLKDSLNNPNVKAFLKTIRKSEGTDALDGYNYLFGSSPRNTLRFTDMSHHPDKHQPFRGGYSSAAGAYQILYDTWEEISTKLSLKDFSPASQDIACVELISQRNVLQKLIDGHFSEAVKVCANIWASLPGAPYGQPVRIIDVVQGWYRSAGGSIS